MSARLKSRHRPLPGGYGFYDSATNFRCEQHADFWAQTRAVQQARMANPGACKRYRKSTDMGAIEDEVDEQWATVARDKGWTDFYIIAADTGGAVEQPFFRRSPAQRLGNLAKAGAVSIGWIKSPDEAVDGESANRRAEVCAKCPLNENGDWLSTFTIPWAIAIRKALELRTGMKLSTPLDSELGVCTACDCPTQLKVHLKIEEIVKNTPTEVYNQFDPGCWILAENQK